MQLPLSWLKEHVEIKEDSHKLAEDLQFSGTKVESIMKDEGDTIFEFEITPNRPDCLSVLGIAREIAAIYNRKLTLPPAFSYTQVKPLAKPPQFEVDQKNLSPGYSVGIIDSIRIGKSPDWLIDKLKKSKIRSINNIVDVTNFVMLETGQPMHAFDFDKIKGGLRLRASRHGEHIVTLDGVERSLPTGAIIIEDEDKLIDLAGIMGGINSEVSGTTSKIVLHVPLYNPLAIRRTSQYLGLRSEASNIFEKKINPIAHRYAFERGAQLLNQVAQGKLVSSIKTVGTPVSERYIEVPLSLIRDTLGISLDIKQIENILERLEFSIRTQRRENRTIIKVEVPLFRTDVTEPIDITEEVGRIYGYNRFPKKLPPGSPSAKSLIHPDFEKRIKIAAASLNMNEIYSSALTSAQVLENMGINAQETLKISNRLVVDYEYLRPTLLIGLIVAAGRNVRNFGSFSLFEIGRIFEGKEIRGRLPNQPKKIAAIFVNSSFYHAKGLVEAFLEILNVNNLEFEETQERAPFGKPITKVSIGGSDVGFLGELREGFLRKFDIYTPTFAFELDLEIIEKNAREISYKPPAKYPVVKEDISLFLPTNLVFSKIEEAVKSAAARNFYELDFIEEKVLSGKHSILLAVKYFDPNKTLKRQDIEKIRVKVIKALVNIGAEPRIK